MKTDRADWSTRLLAILIKRQGGSLHISRRELMEIEDSQLIMEHDFKIDGFKFYIEDDTVVQGELV